MNNSVLGIYTCKTCNKGLVVSKHAWYSNQARQVGKIIGWHCLECHAQFEPDEYEYDLDTEGYVDSLTMR